MSETTRRWRRYPIDLDALYLRWKPLFAGMPTTISKGVPTDARLVRAWIEHDFDGRMRLWLIIASEEFDEVPEGAQIPEHKIQMTNVECKCHETTTEPLGD